MNRLFLRVDLTRMIFVLFKLLRNPLAKRPCYENGELIGAAKQAKGGKSEARAVGRRGGSAAAERGLPHPLRRRPRAGPAAVSREWLGEGGTPMRQRNRVGPAGERRADMFQQLQIEAAPSTVQKPR